MPTKEANAGTIKRGNPLATVRTEKPQTFTTIVAGSSVKQYLLFGAFPFTTILPVAIHQY